ncbi:MAG: peptidase [Methylococcaceae bacterium]|nr:MAG: peptidase [Methylococcaceae bacterium]
MIKTFRHKGLRNFFETGDKSGIQARHESRLRMQLAKLDAAKHPEDMNLPNWRLHPLKGDLHEHWAVWVDRHWRMTFRFDGEDAVLIDYQDYH